MEATSIECVSRVRRLRRSVQENLRLYSNRRNARE